MFDVSLFPRKASVPGPSPLFMAYPPNQTSLSLACQFLDLIPSMPCYADSFTLSTCPPTLLNQLHMTSHSLSYIRDIVLEDVECNLCGKSDPWLDQETILLFLKERVHLFELMLHAHYGNIAVTAADMILLMLHALLLHQKSSPSKKINGLIQRLKNAFFPSLLLSLGNPNMPDSTIATFYAVYIHGRKQDYLWAITHGLVHGNLPEKSRLFKTNGSLPSDSPRSIRLGCIRILAYFIATKKRDLAAFNDVHSSHPTLDLVLGIVVLALPSALICAQKASSSTHSLTYDAHTTLVKVEELWTLSFWACWPNLSSRQRRKIRDKLSFAHMLRAIQWQSPSHNWLGKRYRSSHCQYVETLRDNTSPKCPKRIKLEHNVQTSQRRYASIPVITVTLASDSENDDDHSYMDWDEEDKTARNESSWGENGEDDSISLRSVMIDLSKINLNEAKYDDHVDLAHSLEVGVVKMEKILPESFTKMPNDVVRLERKFENVDIVIEDWPVLLDEDANNTDIHHEATGKCDYIEPQEDMKQSISHDVRYLSAVADTRKDHARYQILKLAAKLFRRYF